MLSKKKYIGITYGDPAGIGPEIVLKTLKDWKRLKFKFKPLVIGLDSISSYKVGSPSKKSALHSYNCLKQTVDLARQKKVISLVTGPVSKQAISSCGIVFSGQTDEIASLCNTKPSSVIMLFASKDFKIALFTRHIALKDVNSKIQKDSLKKFILLLNSELKKWFKIKKPKIAILGLNPHAGEGGLLGNEEEKVIKPVIKSLNLKERSLSIFGPLSPDATLATAGQRYLKNLNQPYDVYVSFYHDQALPLFKAVCGMNGVNVTLGLPFIRVSPAHGTAFDIAGKGKASNEGFVSAIRLVEKVLVKLH